MNDLVVGRKKCTILEVKSAQCTILEVRSAQFRKPPNDFPTSGASVRPENDIKYSTGNEGQKHCVDFSETAMLQRYTASCIVWLSCCRPFWKQLMRMISG